MSAEAIFDERTEQAADRALEQATLQLEVAQKASASARKVIFNRLVNGPAGMPGDEPKNLTDPQEPQQKELWIFNF